MLLLSCKKLPRDNPLDKHNDGDNVEAGIVLEFSKYQVVYDDNSDGIINPGETIYMQVYIKNSGKTVANGVKASISCDENGITNLYPTTEVDYNSGIGSSRIYPGGEDYGDYGYTPDYHTYTVKFKVSTTIADGEELTFNLHISDEEGNEWDDQFIIEVNSTGALINFSEFEIAYDNNHDKVINKGETVYLRVYLKNDGSSQANGVKASISSSDSHISSLYPSYELTYNSGYSSGNIAPGSQKFASVGYTPDYDDYTMKFDVSEETPDNTEISFDMQISDDNGNEWQDTFSVEVLPTAARLEYSKHTIVYEDNQNGQANPGETVYLRVYIKNTGSSQANDVSAVISTGNAYVSNLIPAYALPYNSGYSNANIQPGGEKYASAGYTPNYYEYTLKFELSQAAPSGTAITFLLDILDESGNSWEDEFTLVTN